MIRAICIAAFLLTITSAQTGISLSANAAVVDASPGTGTLTVTATGSWKGTSTSSWLTITPERGEGNATLFYSYSANAGALGRTATIAVAGQTFTLTQGALSGAYTPWAVGGRGVITTAVEQPIVLPGMPPARDPLPAPYSVAVDGEGNIYYADQTFHTIQKIDAKTRAVSTFAGSGSAGESGDGGPAVEAKLYSPYGIAIDPDGNFYIADTGNSRIRKVAAGTGRIETLLDRSAVNGPLDVAFRNGNLYIADSGNNRIMMLDSNGEFKHVAGSGAAGYSGDSGPAGDVKLNAPIGIAVDAAGVVYFTDYYNRRLRRVADGYLTTLAGMDQVQTPRGVAVDPAGNIYVADYSTHRILQLAPGASSMTRFTGTWVAGYSGNGGPASSAQIDSPIDVATDAHGNVYIADFRNRVIRIVDNATPGVTFTPESVTLLPAAGTGTIAMTTTLPATFVRPVSSAAWLTITSSGNSLSYTYPENTTFLARYATITVPGGALLVKQLAIPAALSSRSAVVPARAGEETFSLILGTAARWNATSSADWLTLSRTTGLGTAAIRFTFTANPLARARVATITVAGQVFIVTQAAADGGTSPSGPTVRGGAEVIFRLPFHPGGLAVDANANIYVTDPEGGTVQRISSATGQRSTVASGLFSPTQVTIDPAGFVYVATSGDEGVIRYSMATGKLTNFRAINNVRCLKADRFGNVYLASATESLLQRYEASTGQWTPVRGMGVPEDVAIDAEGNLLAVYARDGQVLRRNAVTGGVSIAVEGFGLPNVVSVNDAGEIFFADLTRTDVRRYFPASGTVVTLPFDGHANAMTLDPPGNLYISDYENNRIVFVELAIPVQRFPPTFVSVSPAISTATQSQTFVIDTQDLNGGEDIARIEFLLDAGADPGPNSCQGYYDRATNRVTTTGGAVSRCEVTAPMATVATRDLRLALTIVRRGANIDGPRQLYLRATDSGGSTTGWVRSADWNPLPPLPASVTATPVSTREPMPTFVFTGSDPNGYSDIEQIEFLISPATDSTQIVCRGAYDRAQDSIAVYSGDCRAKIVDVQAAGTDMTVSVLITPRGGFATGTYHVYARAGGEWQRVSVWNLEAKLIQTFAIPAPNASRIYFLLHNVPELVNAGCHGFWDRRTGTAFVYDDKLAAPASFSNSQCEVEVISVRGDGPGRQVELGLTRKGAFATGTLNLYTWIVDDSGAGSGWEFHSNWSIPEAAAVSRSFPVAAPNANRVYFLIHTEPTIAQNTCHGYWDRQNSRVFLYNDAVSAFIAPYNSQCEVPSVVVNGSDSDLSLIFNFTRRNDFAAGARNLYIWRTGTVNSDSNWTFVTRWAP